MTRPEARGPRPILARSETIVVAKGQWSADHPELSIRFTTIERADSLCPGMNEKERCLFRLGREIISEHVAE